MNFTESAKDLLIIAYAVHEASRGVDHPENWKIDDVSSWRGTGDGLTVRLIHLPSGNSFYFTSGVNVRRLMDDMDAYDKRESEGAG